MNNDKKIINNIALYTTCDHRHLHRKITSICIDSWKNINGLANQSYITDMGLSIEDNEKLNSLGFTVINKEEKCVNNKLINYPNLQRIRNDCPSWRRIIDPAIYLSQYDYLLSIDTDVFINQSIAFPDWNYKVVFQCDDVPAYRAKWTLPLLEPMVLSLNGGFILFKPEIIDLDYLEFVAAKYFSNIKNPWWTHQAIWSVIVGQCPSRAQFSGEDVRNISGLQKRTPKEIRKNRVKFFGKNKAINNRYEIKSLCEGASVIHFASISKKWIYLFEGNYKIKEEKCYIRANSVPKASSIERLLISLRMIAINSKL